MTYDEQLEKYRELPVPKNATYYNKQNAEKTFLEQDSPLGFLELTQYEQRRLIDWCNRLEKVKSFNHYISSYGLKHYFEHDDGFYITNGQFKGAMLICGFQVASTKKINWYFNISKKSVNEIYRRINKLDNYYREKE